MTTELAVKDLALVTGNPLEVGRRFNLVFVAEGYPADKQLTFEQDVQTASNTLLSTTPFNNYQESLNLFRLNVLSRTAGAARGGSPPVDTYFHAWFPGTFPDSGIPPQLLLVDEVLVLNTVKTQLRKAFPEIHASIHKIVVLVNTEYYGGAGGAGDGIAVVSRSLNMRTLLHELGHTFGLVDEYPPDGVLGPNLADTLKPLPWMTCVTTSKLPTVADRNALPIKLDTVGAFQDPSSSSSSPPRYRPQWLCQMRYCCHGVFCAVCSSHIVSQLEKFYP